MVSSVQLSADDSAGAENMILSSSSYDGTIRLWEIPEGDLSSGKCATRLSFTDAVVKPLSLSVSQGERRSGRSCAIGREKKRGLIGER